MSNCLAARRRWPWDDTETSRDDGIFLRCRQIVIVRTNWRQRTCSSCPRAEFRGVGVLAYTMVAERDNQKVTKERTSALILLANARVWASEGWQVVITDADGKQLDPAGFEQWLAPVEASPLPPVNVKVQGTSIVQA